MPGPAAERRLIYGIHAVLAALRLGQSHVTRVYVQAGRTDERIASVRTAAARAGVPVEERARRDLDRLAPPQHQGVVAEAATATAEAQRDLIAFLDTLQAVPFLLVLDGVQDPRNLGACIRTAEAAGAQGVVVPRDRAAGLTPAARKAACGAAERLPLFTVTNLAQTLSMLRARNIWVFGADAAGGADIYQADLRGPLALVFGAEGKGLRRLTREGCDGLVHIPMATSGESLNVSVAVGIGLFEAVRQRRAALKGPV